MPRGYRVLVFANTLIAATALIVGPLLFSRYEDAREAALVTEQRLAIQLRSDPCTALPPDGAACERFISGLTEFVPIDFACAVFAEAGSTALACQRRHLP